MEIIIKIPEHYYENNIKNDLPIYLTEDNIVKILSKGHGDLYDENDIRKQIKNPYQCQTVLYGLKLVKPIIEADKAERNDKE